ncbi:FG-GAP repeat protein [Gloeocapsopsis crepidinum LEGE 06123]|uniref:FG-GAP repeat protein n=1 Tax=Gloeocapsopsis crepidinum LEGE 06123 TaxID=588587 RepID=A0ABR9UYB8_9CHRO|nr:FG-GAP repeat protein [Gloeocapsopsis crepidinum]MBE9193324.1 FG-GAP repeat protein [Gloeocapsopsis crepidinum LEGE 06123]
MATIQGTSGNDTLSGTQNDDTLFGFAGDDLLLGRGGNDVLYGGRRKDTLRGGNGDDTLYGGLGNDVLYGGNGNDTLYGGAGNDWLYGGDGNNTLYGGVGNDTLYGGYYGEDFFYGGQGDDTYIVYNPNTQIIEAPNSGIDTVIFDSGISSYELNANVENLTIADETYDVSGIGNNLDNTITGNSFSNVLRGKARNDLLIGNAGNDILIGTDGTVGDKDTLTGGSGRDTFMLGNTTTVFYDDRNTTSAGLNDYALITDFNIDDFIRLNGKRTDYFLSASSGEDNLLAGTAIFRKVNGEVDELIAIIQGSSSLSLNGNYFKFTNDEFNLSTLNGNNGFVINGVAARDRSGGSVSNAGDVNGDGFDDLIVGAYDANRIGRFGTGASYVVFGKASGFDANLDLATLDGSNGFAINGINELDSSGSSVSNAGDVNGDGVADLIIGAPRGNIDTGASYVIFGKPTGFSAINLATLNGSNGFAINGSYGGNGFGSSVSGAGDINGDGFDDLIIAETGGKGSGVSYVVLGKASGFSANFDLALDGSNSFVILPVDSSSYGSRSSLSSAISNAGDINGDGFDDIVVTGYFADYGQYTSQSYVIFGKASEFTGSFNVATLDGNNGFAINGATENVSNAGDVNGDGFDDLIVNRSFAASVGQYASQSYVIFGKPSDFDANFDLATLDGSNGFVINDIDVGYFSRRSVSSAGDVNADGFDDLIISDANANSNDQIRAGKSYVIFGKASGFDADFDLGTLNSSNGFVINGINTYSLLQVYEVQ